MSIVPQNQNNNQESPFDQIKHIDARGDEYWLGRELMGLLGYARWNEFKKAIERAIASFKAQQDANEVELHFSGAIQKTNGRPKEDYKLSRLGCYLTAMNGDPRKPEIAQAQSYFAIKTREAETVIPQQSDRLRELELQLEIEKAKKERIALEQQSIEKEDAFIQLHGRETLLALRGKADQLIPVKQETIEVIDNRNGTRYSGQTLVQIKNYLNKTHGFQIKSGAEVERILDAIGESGAIGSIPRTVLAKYIPEENLEECVPKIIEHLQQNRQLLIGE